MSVDVDPDNTNPFGEGTSNTGFDDDNAGESIPLLERGASSRRGSEDIAGPSHDRTYGETSFITGMGERTPLLQGESSRAEESLRIEERKRDEAERRILEKRPNFKPANSPFTYTLDELDRVVVRLKRSRGKPHLFFNADGEVNEKLPKTILESLGPPAEEVIEANEGEISGYRERLEELERKLKTANKNQIEGLIRRINELKDGLARLERENEEVKQNMSPRDRIKAIFKKYGFTLIGVLTAVGTVIGVIVSNLKQGLTTLGKGVGSALKSIGKKLGEILPGLVGAIASFVFKTAGEVIGFLGKNAWLLIVGVVVFLIERLKKNAR